MSVTELENQNNQDNQDLQDQTQQTRNLEDTHIDDGTNNDNVETPEQTIARLEQSIARQQFAYRRLETTLEKINRRLEEPVNVKIEEPEPPRNIEEDTRRYFADPQGVLAERDRRFASELDRRDQKIMEHFNKAIAPIRQIAEGFRGSDNYTRLKEHLKQTEPNFARVMNDPDVMALVDSIMKAQDPSIFDEANLENTLGTLKTAIAGAVGSIQMGIHGSGRRPANNSNPNPNPNPNDTRRIDPPNIPPSRSRGRDNAQPAERVLTEDDRTAMRYAGLNANKPEDVKEYWLLMDSSAADVVTTKKGGK